MPAEDQLLSEDEIHLRVAAPDFFKELIDSRTATLWQEGNLEALTAWKQEREQKDRLFAELAPQVKLDVSQQSQDVSFEMQAVQFAAAFNRLAAEYDMPVEGMQIDAEQAARAYAKVLHEKWTQEHQSLPSAAQTIGDEEIPREDMRFVVGREIEASKERHHEATEPTRNALGEMSQAAKDDYLAEQLQAGKAAVKAQEVSLQKTQDRDQEPPDRDR